MKLLLFHRVLSTFVKCYSFRYNVSLLIPLICLQEIRNSEESRGSIKLMKINIIDVLDMRCLFAKLSAL